ncbi:MAG: DUF3558 domain-containing protein [Actinobacteria bacterium]|nr:DUF3558 domain-containing protein [Actinomycetota bacterium]
MRRIGGFAMALLLAASLAACGGDDAPATAPPTTATVAQDVVPFDGEPCSLLSAEQVAQATGYPVTGVRDEPPVSCVFDLATGGNVFVFVSVDDGMGRFGGAANLYEQYLLLAGDGETETVDGIGEGAVCCPFRTLAFDAGEGRFFAVGVAGTFNALAEPLEELKALAAAMLAGL